ncbi:MAG: hypothetical protein IT258_10605 [Saprospiraceae bacterium]|nr:hypothetical protein [Saprospiraceae bacterium]
MKDLGFVLFTFGFIQLYKFSRQFQFKKRGIHSKAIVTNIELVESDDDQNYYYLHLQLPDYHGIKIGKRYEQPVIQSNYHIGEEIDIVQMENAPTDIIIKKEMTTVDRPKTLLVIGLVLWILAYAACNWN